MWLHLVLSQKQAAYYVCHWLTKQYSPSAKMQSIGIKCVIYSTASTENPAIHCGGAPSLIQSLIRTVGQSAEWAGRSISCEAKENAEFDPWGNAGDAARPSGKWGIGRIFWFDVFFKCGDKSREKWQDRFFGGGGYSEYPGLPNTAIN